MNEQIYIYLQLHTTLSRKTYRQVYVFIKIFKNIFFKFRQIINPNRFANDTTAIKP